MSNKCEHEEILYASDSWQKYFACTKERDGRDYAECNHNASFCTYKEGNENYIEIKTPKKYCVDFDKIKTLDDLKNVVQILFAGLPITINEDCGFIDEIKEYLVEV